MGGRGYRSEPHAEYSKYTEWVRCFPALARLSRGRFVGVYAEWRRVDPNKECDLSLWGAPEEGQRLM